MASKVKNNPKVTQVNGINVYKDEKQRTIYAHPFTKKAVYIPTFEEKKFNIYQKRFLLAACAFILLTTILADWFELPAYVPILICVALLLVMEFKFHQFLKGLQPVKHFNKEKCFGFFDALAQEDKGKMIARIIAYTALGVVMVLNAYESNFGIVTLTACWIIMAGLLLYSGILAYSLTKRK